MTKLVLSSSKRLLCTAATLGPSTIKTAITRSWPSFVEKVPTQPFMIMHNRGKSFIDEFSGVTFSIITDEINRRIILIIRYTACSV